MLDWSSTICLSQSVPAIHLFNARFKEQIGDVLAARAAYIHRCKETDSDFVENVISKANMEKRLVCKLACTTTEEKLTLHCSDAVIMLLHVLLYIFNVGKYGVCFQYIQRSA